MSDQSDTFLREVQEDIQRERMQKLWDQYGTYALGGVAAFVLGVAAYKYNESSTISAAEAQSGRYALASKALALAKDGRDDTAQKALDSLAKSGGGYGLLAELRLAGLEATGATPAKAIATYDAIANRNGVDRSIAEFARIQSAKIAVDTEPYANMQARLTDLAAADGQWRHVARELLGLAAFKAGNTTEARTHLGGHASDPTVPRSIAERANLLMSELAQADLAKTLPAVAAPATGDSDPKGKDATKAEPAAQSSPQPPTKKK